MDGGGGIAGGLGETLGGPPSRGAEEDTVLLGVGLEERIQNGFDHGGLAGARPAGDNTGIVGQGGHRRLLLL